MAGICLPRRQGFYHQEEEVGLAPLEQHGRSNGTAIAWPFQWCQSELLPTAGWRAVGKAVLWPFQWCQSELLLTAGWRAVGETVRAAG